MYVQRTERLEKSLEQLRRGDGRAAMAARTAEGIIRSISAGDVAAVNHKLTCHGEARLDKAVKFDLGGGYRMVSVRWGDAFLMLFAGSHDDCDRWLERNRGSSFELEPMVASMPDMPRVDTFVPSSNAFPEENAMEDSGREFSQRDLRFLFRGLCGG